MSEENVKSNEMEISKAKIVKEANLISMAENTSTIPPSIAGKLELARVFLGSGLVPHHFKTAEAVFVALQMGLEVGLKPWVALSNISVINGKAGLMTDVKVALVKTRADYQGMTVEFSPNEDKCTVRMARMLPSGAREEATGKFSLEEAKKAGLMIKDNWAKYPSRMLKHRATDYAIRDLYPEVFAGIYSPDELEEIDLIDESGSGYQTIKRPSAQEMEPIATVPVNNMKEEEKPVFKETKMRKEEPKEETQQQAVERLIEAAKKNGVDVFSLKSAVKEASGKDINSLTIKEINQLIEENF